LGDPIVEDPLPQGPKKEIDMLLFSFPSTCPVVSNPAGKTMQMIVGQMNTAFGEEGSSNIENASEFLNNPLTSPI